MSKPVLILIYLRDWSWHVTPTEAPCCGFLRTSVEVQQVQFLGEYIHTFHIHKALAQGTNEEKVPKIKSLKKKKT